MENGSYDFLHHLGEAIAARATWLETVRIPQVKDMLGTYRSLFESIAGTLLKKGLLREDPYEYEENLKAMVPPADSALSETGDDGEVSRRMAAYRRQLAFLFDSVPMKLASLDPPLVGKISLILSYVDWDNFGEGSASATTRVLARLMTQVRLGKDALSSRVLHESQTQIETFLREIRLRLAEIHGWHNESWKAEVRARVLPQCVFPRAKAGEANKAKSLVIRKVFEQVLPDGTWYPHLIQEILSEDHPESAADRRAKLLASLAIPLPPVAAAPQLDAAHRRAEILEAVRNLSRLSEEVQRCQEILVENERGVEKRRLSFFQRIRRWIQKSQGRLDDRFYEIEYSFGAGEETRTETVDFLKFVSEMREVRAVLEEVALAGSPAHRRIAAMNEEQLCDFLDWQLRQLRHMHFRMEGLNAFFQVKAVHERGGTARSIKLGLLAMENGMNRAEAVHHESIDRLEKKALSES